MINWTTIIVVGLICGTVLALYGMSRKDGKR
jgi:hypothetical protein